jgi:hypothetical protein
MTTTAPVLLDTLAVTALFAQAATQGEYIVGLYKMVHPDWDRITALNGHPTCSKATWCRICELARAHDDRTNLKRTLDKQIFPGGGWMNSGFSSSEATDADLSLWEVLPTPEEQITRV